ncbi:MAG: helix-turn-helix transcriptional regulator [Bacteroidales bacterium]
MIKTRSKWFEHFRNQEKTIINKVSYSSIDEQFLADAITYVEKRISEEELDLDLFASELCVSRSVLYRKLKSLTNYSPNDFIKKIRLKTAWNIMKEKKVTIAEVAFHVGISNPKYFSTIFRKEYGMTPSKFMSNESNNEEEGDEE